jgi:hypothetical protein
MNATPDRDVTKPLIASFACLASRWFAIATLGLRS